jgi:hypothetical protein
MHSTIQWCKYLTIATILHIELLTIEQILSHPAIEGFLPTWRKLRHGKIEKKKAGFLMSR